MKQGIVIDADGHVNELNPKAVDWKKYMEPAYKARAPEYRPRGPLDQGLYIDGEPFPKAQFPNRRMHGKSSAEHLHADRSGMWDHKVRVQHLDMDTIDVAVLYGTGICERNSDLPDAGLAAAISRAYNNWLHDFCSYAPTRLKGAASVPLQDMEAAVAEANRAVTELGFVGVGILPYSQGKLLMDPYFYPLYEELQRLDAVLGLHYLGGASPIGMGRFDSMFFNHTFQHPYEQMLAVQAIVAGGVLDHFPRLRVGFLEGDCGWLPWWMHRMDSHYEKLADTVPAKARPSEYLKGSQCYVGCEGDEPSIPYVAEVVGEDRLVFASDYWHWDGTFPGAVAEMTERKDVSERVKRKVLGENAARLYKLS